MFKVDIDRTQDKQESIKPMAKGFKELPSHWLGLIVLQQAYQNLLGLVESLEQMALELEKFNWQVSLEWNSSLIL